MTNKIYYHLEAPSIQISLQPYRNRRNHIGQTDLGVVVNFGAQIL